MKIGILGYGVIGKATHASFTGLRTVSIYDPPLGHEELPLDTEANFICVPTPTVNGTQDVSILNDVLSQLSENGYEGLVIIKSTTLPSNVTMLCNRYDNLNIMTNPEFLDQAAPYFEQDHYLLGIDNIEQADFFRKLYLLEERDRFRTTSREGAMMAKYMHNCFGALKVTFFNEMKDTCDSLGLDYRETVGAMLSATKHISPCYTKMSVDGERGFGGACFGKDLVAFNSMWYVHDNFPYNCHTLNASILRNLSYRPEYMKKLGCAG